MIVGFDAVCQAPEEWIQVGRRSGGHGMCLPPIPCWAAQSARLRLLPCRAAQRAQSTDPAAQGMHVDKLPLGRRQPFYHVLVDVRCRPGGQTTYVAQVGACCSRGVSLRRLAHAWGASLQHLWQADHEPPPRSTAWAPSVPHVSPLALPPPTVAPPADPHRRM